jgi:hypothetical protein
MRLASTHLRRDRTREADEALKRTRQISTVEKKRRDASAGRTP